MGPAGARYLHPDECVVCAARKPVWPAEAIYYEGVLAAENAEP